jgi:hypothetical protein
MPFHWPWGLGMNNRSYRYILRASSVVGIFHIFMPLGGALTGNFLGSLMGKMAVWAGGLILVFLGLKMIWEGFPWRRSCFSFQEARKELDFQRTNPVSSWGGAFCSGLECQYRCLWSWNRVGGVDEQAAFFCTDHRFYSRFDDLYRPAPGPAAGELDWQVG